MKTGEQIYSKEAADIHKIPYGKWLIKELISPKHLVLSDDILEVSISEQNQVIELEAVNEIVYGSVMGLKIDDRKEPIKGVVFGLFSADTTEFTEENALALSESAEDGLFVFNKLRFGKYLIKELSCPDSYVMSEETIKISITENEQVVSLTVTNKRIDGKVQVYKINSKNHKEKLSGAVFEVYLDVNENEVFDAEVDTLYAALKETEKGLYELEDLKCGGYFLYETEAPKGFKRDERYFYFQISADDDTVTVENEIGTGFTNEPGPNYKPGDPDSPQTGDESKLWLWILLAGGSLAIIISFAILEIRRHRAR